MRTRLLWVCGALFACAAMPWLARLPKGLDWVAQYVPDEGYRLSGLVYFGAFSLLPGIVAALMTLLSKPPFHLPVSIATGCALMFLAYTHSQLDLASDAQAAIALIFIPIYAAGLALLGGLVGWGIQALLTLRQKAAG